MYLNSLDFFERRLKIGRNWAEPAGVLLKVIDWREFFCFSEAMTRQYCPIVAVVLVSVGRVTAAGVQKVRGETRFDVCGVTLGLRA
jgi:hypothetical protein